MHTRVNVPIMKQICEKTITWIL